MLTPMEPSQTPLGAEAGKAELDSATGACLARDPEFTAYLAQPLRHVGQSVPLLAGVCEVEALPIVFHHHQQAFPMPMNSDE
jgi:hypothetical protein